MSHSQEVFSIALDTKMNRRGSGAGNRRQCCESVSTQARERSDGHLPNRWAPLFGGRNGFTPPEKHELALSIETGCADTVPFQPKTKHPVLTRPISNPQNPFSTPKILEPSPIVCAHRMCTLLCCATIAQSSCVPIAQSSCLLIPL